GRHRRRRLRPQRRAGQPVGLPPPGPGARRDRRTRQRRKHRPGRFQPRGARRRTGWLRAALPGSSSPMQISLVGTILQAVGMLLIAGLLGLLTPSIGRRFLAYWAAAWASLAGSLTALSLAFLLSGLSYVFLAVYCLAEYLFGFLLWAGCRHFARGQALRP